MARPSFSLLSNLGMIPDSLQVGAFEVTPRFVPAIGLRIWPQLENRCLVVNGDAHRLNEMQGRTLLMLEAPEIGEIELACKGEKGRQVRVAWPDVA